MFCEGIWLIQSAWMPLLCHPAQCHMLGEMKSCIHPADFQRKAAGLLNTISSFLVIALRPFWNWSRLICLSGWSGFVFEGGGEREKENIH